MNYTELTGEYKGYHILRQISGFNDSMQLLQTYVNPDVSSELAGVTICWNSNGANFNQFDLLFVFKGGRHDDLKNFTRTNFKIFAGGYGSNSDSNKEMAFICENQGGTPKKGAHYSAIPVVTNECMRGDGNVDWHNFDIEKILPVIKGNLDKMGEAGLFDKKLMGELYEVILKTLPKKNKGLIEAKTRIEATEVFPAIQVGTGQQVQ